MYKPKFLVCIEIENKLPIFGRITEILLLNNDIYFVIKKLNTLFFHENYHAYRIEESNNF